ncbi:MULTISPECIES: hypothetical protein [Halobacterium]|uniref:hypothetical protein n=1 Tax=Halobacterium TaxID=2239 RepID=UPI00073EDE0D|nr:MULTISPECIES: hypothetical protein [Halobacterium]MCG1003737.1 hypothetical protein [Halobacterium noricense]
MRFRDDNRAQSVQVGAILLFATLVIALSIYQATVVPSQNADVEYKHSQTVQNQMTDVRNGILRSAATGNAQPASVTLGTQYPSRAFLMNPPPATGTLRTGSYENNTIRVSNINATNDETKDFLNGSWTASTKYLEYEPDYNEYDNAPNLLYETSVLSNFYPDTNNGTAIPLTDQMLVDNETRTITLVTLNGSLSTSRASSVTVSPETLSAPYQRVQVQPNQTGEPVNVSVPTRLSASQLESRTDLGSHPGVIDVVDVPNEDRVVAVVEWSGEFTLQTARLGVGSGTENPPAHYLTLVENRGDRVTVEARDRFNNAESGVKVNVNESTVANIFENQHRVTNQNGQTTFVVNGGKQGSVTLAISANENARENVTVDVDATDSGGSDDEDSPSTFESKIIDQGQTGSLARYETSYDATGVTDFDRVEVTYENLDSGGADQTYASFEPRNNIDDYGWEDEYGGTGGDEYEITIEVFNESSGNPVAKRTVTDTADSEDPSGNDDLSESDSPTLASSSLIDTTENNNARYTVDYDVSDSAGKFTETEVLFLNEDSVYVTDQRTITGTTGTAFYSAGGAENDQYQILVQVQDDDGIVVDQRLISDVANGSVDGSSSSATSTQVNNFGKNAGQDRFTAQVQSQDTDGDNDMDRIEYVVVDSDENVVATATRTGSGQQIQPGTITIQSDANIQGGETYTLLAVGYDQDGNYDWATGSA